MSNIPFNTISNAMDALQRPANETLRARKVQAQKNLHHNEDVEELDDTAIDSIRDQSQQQDQQEQDPKPHTEERLDIQSLKTPDNPLVQKPTLPRSHLDISA